ncbi:hypothetical protein GE061_015450 [Apolygus lucorum]|uniref:Uncharacterized protein n=1 Tax=Apolygus lucorum TaxID=248454 RepID=A0A8S9XN34_APOLU|nr:hypothetical protein GE061_015450 [Apolygus lucorum]
MERIRAERTVARRIFSRACTALDQELKKEEVDYESACAKMRTVEYEAQKLFEIDEDMKVKLFAEKMDEEDQVKEFEDMSDFRMDVLKAWSRFRLTPAAATIGSEKTPDLMVANIIVFLKAEGESDERKRLSTNGLSSSENQKFNPPIAAWWGGWWERVVWMIKELVMRNLGQAALTYEELTTVICDIEAVINARPLTYVAEEAEELQPISPKLFIQDIKSTKTDFDTLLSGDHGTGWDQHAESSTV